MASSAALARTSRAVSINPDNPDVLEIIKEDTISITSTDTANKTLFDCCCTCYKKLPEIKIQTVDTSKPDPKLLEDLINAKEKELTDEFEEKLQKETNYLKERFDFILQNEQIRAAYKLREAHRERKEKIKILQQQLECKNLAGMMYVMCAERTRSKLEKLQIIEKFTNYINMLNEILTEGQDLILNLSRGFKTAARVDFEWREKMNKVVAEFQKFICHYTGTSPEQNQYFFDMPSLLETESPKEDNPSEDPIEEEEEETNSYISQADLLENKSWWERLDDECRPFVVFGDMADFKPPQRREALKQVKAPKTAPKKWKDYTFHDMFMLSSCPNADSIKHEYFERLPDPGKWECQAPPTERDTLRGTEPPYTASRRVTTASVDIRGNMGSILKIITASGLNQQPVTKANLLGARDSMEIASTTRVRDKIKSVDTGKVEIKVGSRRTSFFDTKKPEEDAEEDDMKPKDDKSVISHKRESSISHKPSTITQPITGRQSTLSPAGTPGERQGTTERKSMLVENAKDKAESDQDDNKSAKTEEGDEHLTQHTDSLTVIPHHVPERDHNINYEKICPLETCQRLHMDSFMKTLPVYMRENTFTYREQTFDKYETCTKEQLEILKQRIQEGKKKDKEKRATQVYDQNPLLEWKASVEGIGCQTSGTSFMELPPCNCKDSSIISGEGAVYRVEDLIPMKMHLDHIRRECLYDNQVEFNRFKVLGQDSRGSAQALKQQYNTETSSNFTRRRLQEIRKILKQHPSLCEIFQANTQC